MDAWGVGIAGDGDTRGQRHPAWGSTVGGGGAVEQVHEVVPVPERPGVPVHRGDPGSGGAGVFDHAGFGRRLAITPPRMLPSAFPTAWAPRNAHFGAR